MMLKIKYSYISSQVMRHQNVFRYDAEKNQAYLKGYQQGTQAFVTLNRHHKLNILSPSMIDQIIRFLDSYDLDDSIRQVWLDSHPSIFSKGTDIKYLKTLNEQQKGDYLKQIQDLSIYLGTYNKPLLPIVRGEVSGSMASLIGTQPFTLCQKASFRWNDIAQGLLPHAGGSYVLSRLPYEIGVYLSLTGRWLSSQEATRLKLGYGILNDQQTCIDFIREYVLEQKYIRTSDQYGNMVSNWQCKMEEGAELFYEKLVKEMTSRIETEDAELVVSEIMYKLKKFEAANQYDVVKPQQLLSNPLLNFKENTLDVLDELDAIIRPKDNSTKMDLALISRCFSSNSVKEIKERLAEEQNEIADGILKDLEERSEEISQMALNLIRQAEKLQWRDCLNLEFIMCMDILKVKSIPLGTLPFALQPVKEFYEKYPDNIRLFLNEQNLRGDLQKRADQEIDILSYMENNQHPHDGSISVATMRQMQSELQELKRDLEINYNKLRNILQFPENLKIYLEKRKAYINNISETDLESTLENAITSYYKNKLDARLDAYTHIAQIANIKQKRSTFSKLRNFILNSKLTKPVESDIMNIDSKGAMAKLLVFPENDQESFLFSAPAPLKPDKHLQFENFNQGQKKIHLQAQAYKLKYGDYLQEFQPQMNRYYQTLIAAGNNNPSIKAFLEGKEDQEIIQILKDNQAQFFVEIENIYPQTQEKLKQFEAELNALKLTNKITVLPKSADVFTWLSQNESVSKLILPVFDQKYSAFAGSLRNKLESLLNKMYQIRSKRFQEFNKLGLLDEQLNYILKQDAFKLIENNLIFSYSYVVLMELDDIYNFLDTHRNTQMEILYRLLNETYGFKINKQQEFDSVMEYLNKILEASTSLYNMYREQVRNHSDKLLDAYVRIEKNNDKDVFRSRALLSRDEIQRTQEERDRHLQALDGKYVPLVKETDVLTQLEQANMSEFESEDFDQESEQENDTDLEESQWANKHEHQVYDKLSKYLDGKQKEQKQLILGLHHYLQQIDLISSKQQTVIPQHILKGKQELQEMLNMKWFSNDSLEEWLPKFVEQTVADLFNCRKGGLDFKLAEILEGPKFKQALLMELRKDQQVLESLRTAILDEGAHDREIQALKLNTKAPKIENLPLQMTLNETFKIQGLQEHSDLLDMFVGGPVLGLVSKEARQKTNDFDEEEYRKLQKKMMGRVDKVVQQWKSAEMSEEIMDNLFVQVQKTQ